MFATQAKDYKLRPNEELAERLCTKLLQSNFERDIKELSIGCCQLPWMIRFTALFGQFHPSSYTRSLFYLVQDALKKTGEQDKANRLFVRLQINRNYYSVKEGRKQYKFQKTMTSKSYHRESKIDDTGREQKAWALHDQSMDFLSALQLPERKRWQPFLITIGLVPKTIQPLDPK
ncbi:MAG: hypothetical protein QE263_03460 [Vampirovibrionales bacterium]|nr:hypothetical protein [Vampirovibrionales bacterium]